MTGRAGPADHGDRSEPTGRVPVGVEGVLSRQRRLIIHARFRGGDEVSLGYPSGSSLDQYRRSGRVGQLLSRAWVAFMALCGGAMLLGGVLAAVQPLGWLPQVGAAVFGMGGGYWGLYHLAGWRCMRRYRKPLFPKG